MTSRNRIKLGNVAVAGLSLATLVAVGVWLDRSVYSDEPVAPPVVIEGTLTVDAPSSAVAGEPFLVSLSGEYEGEIASLVIDGGYGQRNLSAIMTDGVATFEVPPWPHPESGLVLLEASVGLAQTTATMEIAPGPATDPLDIYLGPRTVVADANDFSMAVAIPKDRYGNPVSEGTPVDFSVNRSSGTSATQAAPTSGLLASVEIWSRTRAGRTRVGASVGAAKGPERSFLEVAGVPVAFDLGSTDPAPAADGSTLFEVWTDVLHDEFGNVVPDGTVAYLRAAGSTSNRRLRGTSIDGVVTFVVEAPAEPGPATFVASASGVASESLTIDFSAAVARAPVTVSDHDDGVHVEIGRVVGTTGSYVPDGTVALINVEDTVYSVELELGRGSVVVPPFDGTPSVSILGVGATSIEDAR